MQVQGILIANPLSTITILISIAKSSLLKHPLQWKLRVFGIKNYTLGGNFSTTIQPKIV